MSEPIPNSAPDAHDPLTLLQHLLTGSARRLSALSHSYVQYPLSPPQIELALIRLTHEAMRALLAQAQVRERAAKGPLTAGVQTALAELRAHAQQILAQIQDLEGQRQLDQLTVPQRQAALVRATAAHTRLLQARGLLEAQQARHVALDKPEVADSDGHWQEVLAAGAALMAQSQQVLAALRPPEAAPLPDGDGHAPAATHGHLMSATATSVTLVRPEAPPEWHGTPAAALAADDGARATPDLPGRPVQSPQPRATGRQNKKGKQKRKASNKPRRRR
jgi:hypothetical protein